MNSSNTKQLSQKTSVDMNVLLGKGSTGNVYKGVSSDPRPHPIAVKVIPLEQINNEVTSYLLECELQALKATSKFPNKSIVKLQEIVVVENNCYIATELLEGGTLKQFIKEKKKIQPVLALQILEKLLQGYKVLKENGIIHRDLKPENILFLSNPSLNPREIHPKIIDFGYCSVEKVNHKPKMFYNVGSPRYMSPQAYTNNKYSQKSDIWALGIVFYQMLTGTNFDKGKNILETFKLIKEKGIPIPSSLNTKCRKILQHMLMLDSGKRWNCEELLEAISRQQGQKVEFHRQITDLTSSLPLKDHGNRSITQLRSTIFDNKRIDSPKCKSPHARVSITNNLDDTLRSSGFLTKSLGFNLTPVSNSNDNRISVFNSNQLRINYQMEKIINKNFKQIYKEGPSTERKPLQPNVQNEKVKIRPFENGFNQRTLSSSTSQQNLNRINHNLALNQSKRNQRENIAIQSSPSKYFAQQRSENVKQRKTIPVFPFRLNQFRTERVLTIPPKKGETKPKQIGIENNISQNHKVNFINTVQDKKNSQKPTTQHSSLHVIPANPQQQKYHSNQIHPQHHSQGQTVNQSYVQQHQFYQKQSNQSQPQYHQQNEIKNQTNQQIVHFQQNQNHFQNQKISQIPQQPHIRNSQIMQQQNYHSQPQNHQQYPIQTQQQFIQSQQQKISRSPMPLIQQQQGQTVPIIHFGEGKFSSKNIKIVGNSFHTEIGPTINLQKLHKNLQGQQQYGFKA